MYIALNHVDLPVADIPGAAGFFESHFGFRTVMRRPDGLTVLLGDDGFALTLSPLVAGCDGSWPAGFHIGFNLRDEGEFHALHGRLKDGAIPFVRDIARLGGAETFQILAPGGVRVEIAFRP